jgi:hypothetical protein
MAKKQRKPRATLEERMKKLDLQAKQIDAKKKLYAAREEVRKLSEATK